MWWPTRGFMGLDSVWWSTHAIWIAAAGVFLLAGFVKGVIGLGLPTVSMALLALWMRPSEAAAWLVIPTLATNLWQLTPVSTLGPAWRRVGAMQIGICVGTIGGALVLGTPNGASTELVLGASLLAYAVWGLLGRVWHVPATQESWLGPIVGLTTGAIAAVTGVFVVPAVAYLQALGLQRDELIQTMGISFTVSTLALATGLMLSGRYSIQTAGMSLGMLVPALAGMAVGQWCRKRLSPTVFRRWFFISLALLGAYMLLKPHG